MVTIVHLFYLDLEQVVNRKEKTEKIGFGKDPGLVNPVDAEINKVGEEAEPANSLSTDPNQ